MLIWPRRMMHKIGMAPYEAHMFGHLAPGLARVRVHRALHAPCLRGSLLAERCTVLRKSLHALQAKPQHTCDIAQSAAT